MVVVLAVGAFTAAPADARGPKPRRPMPAYASSIAPLNADQRALMMDVAWRPGCPVGLDDLRAVTVRYATTRAWWRDGVIVVHEDIADEVARIFGRLYDARYAIERIEPIELYAGDDDLSVQYNNTSGFNCRNIDGTNRWSRHAYGEAIDLNPLWNPWVRADGTTKLVESRPFVDRSRTDVPGMIKPGDAVVEAFAAEGWTWGGNWRTSKDYQHFQS
jgi:hypothetical protein